MNNDVFKAISAMDSYNRGTDTEMRRAILGKVTGAIFDVPPMGYVVTPEKSVVNRENEVLSAVSGFLSRKEV